MNILKINGTYQIHPSVEVIEKLSNKNYELDFDTMSGSVFLKDTFDFNYPEKIYDINIGFRDMVKKTFDNQNTNLGVLLSGNKGQGKSLNAKLLCKLMNLPVIMINKKIPNNIDFISFLNKINCDYLLFIDEFEKIFPQNYNKDNEFHEQSIFLNFMDGSVTSNYKKLFLLTVNEDINQYMINRPSRIKFLVEYNEFPEELFHVITDDLLIDKNFKEDLYSNISFINLNIDLLISIIEQINLHNKAFSEFKLYFNYKQENFSYDIYDITGGNEKFQTTYHTSKKIKTNDRYIDDDYVNEILKMGDDGIVYSTNDYDKDTEKNVKKIKKAVLMKNTSNKFF